MLAWNAQCKGPRVKQMPSAEVYKIDKLRGTNQGTGDFAWKVEALRQTKASLAAQKEAADQASREAAQARAERAQRLQQQAAAARLKQEAFARAPIETRFRRSSTLIPDAPPVAALLPHRVGSPGSIGVRKQLAAFAQQAQSLDLPIPRGGRRTRGQRGGRGDAEGEDPLTAALRNLPVSKHGVPIGFHEGGGRSRLPVWESHRQVATHRAWNHHDTPLAIDNRPLAAAEFQPRWKPLVTQVRVHSFRDLA